MRALFICTYGDFAATFEKNNINILQNMGYEVHVASNFADASKNRNIHVLKEMHVKLHHINFERNPFSKQGITNIKELNKLIKKYRFEEIDCHNPVCGILGRICGKINRVPNIIYTAHGFHFFKGAPLKNWILYFPAEWICSWMTDVLITINTEDYERAKKHLHAKRTEYIPGVGVDVEKFAVCYVDKKVKCRELGIPDDKFILLSVGELQERKNHRVVIEALGQMQNKDIYYLIAGQGILQEQYKQLIQKYHLEENIKLLGYRMDIDELCEIADCFVHPSIREGLGIAPLEAMASGLPLIAADINGIKDYAIDDISGCCVAPCSVTEMKEAINKMFDDRKFRERCSYNNIMAAKEFSVEKSDEIMNMIYRTNVCGRGEVKHTLALIKAEAKRKELKIEHGDFVIISVGELNRNKNHEVIIKALAELHDPHIKYIICGQGELREYLKNKIKQCKLENQIMILGYRTDIKELLTISDLFAFPSKREGLGVAALEAMAAGLPLLTSNIHGINDYSIQNVTGYKRSFNDHTGFAKDIVRCKEQQYTRYNMGTYNQCVVNMYRKCRVEEIMRRIYGGG